MLSDLGGTNHEEWHSRDFDFAFSHMHGRPCLPSAQFDSGKEVEIAAIHPDFCAAEPLSLMEFAGRVLISLTSFSLP
jgi:hypothetical protein